MVAQPLKTVACKRCGVEFKQKTITQGCCSRKCYYLFYSKKDAPPEYPMLKCYGCGKDVQLEFDPVKEYKQLEGFICPHCGHPRKETIK